MKANIHTLMAGSLMLTVALAAGCERESKGPRVYNHPPATVGPPADLSQFDAPAPPAPGEAKPVPVAQVAAPAPAAGSLELRPEVADVVDMAKRGVGDEALLAFVEQNPVTHRIAAETIIFLNDLGVPENVVALMIRQGDAVQEVVPMEPAPVTGQPVASTPPPTPPRLAKIISCHSTNGRAPAKTKRYTPTAPSRPPTAIGTARPSRLATSGRCPPNSRSPNETIPPLHHPRWSGRLAARGRRRLGICR